MNKLTTGKALLGLMIIMLLQACGSKEKYTFEYNLKEGDTFKQNSMVDMQITQSMMGQEMTISTALNGITKFVVTKVEENLYAMDMEYEKTKMDMDMGATKISLDSETTENVATIENMGPIFKAMIGKPIHITMDKYGNVAQVNGFDKLMEDMFASIDISIDEATRSQLMDIVKQQHSEEAVKELFRTSFVYSNGKEVAVGDSWDIKKELSNNGIALTVNSKMTLKSVKDNMATIQVTGDLGTPEGGVTQTLQGFESKMSMNGTQEGEMTVDVNTGMVKSINMTQNINGELEMMGMKLPQTIVIKLTMTDK